MPWYYIEVHSGGGHQSTTSKWVWRDKPVSIKTSVDVENFVDGEFDGYYLGESAIFHVKRVKKLPVQTHDRQLANYRSAIANAHKMLDILFQTPTHPPRCNVETSRYPGDPHLQHLTGRCNRALHHRGKHESQKRHNREKFGEY